MPSLSRHEDLDLQLEYRMLFQNVEGYASFLHALQHSRVSSSKKRNIASNRKSEVQYFFPVIYNVDFKMVD